MRRTIILALLAALLLAPSASADPIKILRDCNDDGKLQGSYSASELREARNELPTDADEYSDCRDVLSRAIANASGSKTGGEWKPETSTGNGTGDSGLGGSTGGNGGETGGSGDDAAPPAESPTPASTPHDPAEDKALLTQAAENGDRAVLVDGQPVSPGASKLAAQVGRNGVPATTVGVIALFVVALLAAGALPLLRRRRGVDRPEA